MTFVRLQFTLLCIFAGPVSVVAGAEPEAKIIGNLPELGVAVMADAKNINIHRFVTRMITRTIVAELPPGLKIEATQGTIEPLTTTEVVPIVESQVTRIEVSKVVARRLSGGDVSHQALKDALRKPTPVIYGIKGQPLEPIFNDLFTPDALILLLPPSPAAPTVAPDLLPSTQPR